MKEPTLTLASISLTTLQRCYLRYSGGSAGINLTVQAACVCVSITACSLCCSANVLDALAFVSVCVCKGRSLTWWLFLWRPLLLWAWPWWWGWLSGPPPPGPAARHSAPASDSTGSWWRSHLEDKEKGKHQSRSVRTKRQGRVRASESLRIYTEAKHHRCCFHWSSGWSNQTSTYFPTTSI